MSVSNKPAQAPRLEESLVTQRVMSQASFLLDSDIPLVFLRVFMYVATNEGVNMQGIMESLVISQSSCSRAVATMSNHSRIRQRGFGLLEAREDPTDRRTKQVFLTKKGRSTYLKLFAG